MLLKWIAVLVFRVQVFGARVFSALLVRRVSRVSLRLLRQCGFAIAKSLAAGLRALVFLPCQRCSSMYVGIVFGAGFSTLLSAGLGLMYRGHG